MPNNGSAALLLRLGLAEQAEDHAEEMQALRRLICAEVSPEEKKHWKACLRKLSSPETVAITLNRHGKRARAASVQGTALEASGCGSSEAAFRHKELGTSRIHGGVGDNARGALEQHQEHTQGERAASAVGLQARSQCGSSAPNLPSFRGLIRPGHSSSLPGAQPCSAAQTGGLRAGEFRVPPRAEQSRRAHSAEADALAAAARPAGPLLALWAKPQSRTQTQPVQDRDSHDAETCHAPQPPFESALAAARHGDAASADPRAAQAPHAAAAGQVPAMTATEATSPVRSSTQKKIEEELQCPICMDLLYEPISIKCGHSFCRICLLKATEHQRPRCPCCRGALEANYIPKVNVLLWNLIQNSFSAQIKLHANARLGQASEALELARRDGALRDRLRAEMLTHRDVLVAAMPHYFQMLELELKRPTSEIFRCECPQRFVCPRKRVANLVSTSYGREYAGCPLYSSVDPSRGCRFYTNIV